MKKLNVGTEHSSILIACLFIFAVLFVCLPPQAKAQYQPPDSCIKMIWPNDYDVLTNTGSYNPDSVKADSCEYSKTFGKLFAKKYYYLKLPQNYYPFDSILTKNDFKNVNDISDNYKMLKNTFDSLQGELGAIYFTGLEDNPPDSIFMLNPWIKIFFEKYQDYKFIEYYLLNSIDTLIEVYYAFRAIQPTNVNEDLINKYQITISPNPVIDIIKIDITSNDYGLQIIEIFNDIFNIVYHDSCMKLNDNIIMKLDLSFLPNGIFFLKNGSKIKKFIISK